MRDKDKRTLVPEAGKTFLRLDYLDDTGQRPAVRQPYSPVCSREEDGPLRLACLAERTQGRPRFFAKGRCMHRRGAGYEPAAARGAAPLRTDRKISKLQGEAVRTDLSSGKGFVLDADTRCISHTAGSQPCLRGLPLEIALPWESGGRWVRFARKMREPARRPACRQDCQARLPAPHVAAGPRPYVNSPLC